MNISIPYENRIIEDNNNDNNDNKDILLLPIDKWFNNILCLRNM